MTSERARLQCMAREQRHAAWWHARRLPGRASDVVGALTHRYPLWSLALAAGWLVLQRSPRKPRRRWKAKPLGAPLGAMATALTARILAQVPHLLGLAWSRRFRGPGTEAATPGRGGADPRTTKTALVESGSHGC